MSGQWEKDFYQNGRAKNQEIQDFIQNSQHWNSKYLGFVSGDEKIKAFNNSDLLVLPSYTEGFSISVLEAMAMGLPVITTPVGAMPEVVKNGVNGLITPIGNVEKLAENIEILMNDKELYRKISEYNPKYVRENFDIEQVAKQLIEILG